ncbi:MAG: GNAT family N-acetyltransferase [Candidatus Devosia euplotis]|nr:GNAT family N-acetyltransferase [Candidatus Devosia euplotis]
MRQSLWPETGPDEHRTEIAAQLDRTHDAITLIVRLADGTPAGFAEASIRHDPVNGCDTSPVGFVEGVYVAPEYRRRGLTQQLLASIESWERHRGCRELASDAPLDNAASHQMHHALGFEETGRVVCFRKVIG